MRVPSFTVRDQRSIRYAECDQVPPMMVIAGPNGAGKSTLLHGIRTHSGITNILYVGPHRAMRKQQVQQRHLSIAPISIESILASNNIPGHEGIRIFEGNRDPWGYDDSANYLKHGLCQIEVERQAAIADRFDSDGEIPKGSLLDPWQPLKQLTHHLLPHLSFHRIDSSIRDQIKCLWQVHTKGTFVDIDDLSSGEKSIIQMFYPLIERQIKALIQAIRDPSSQLEEKSHSCVLIDEPELHLHPNLQLKVLDYLRLLTSTSKTQVILATHSPTMVEYASFEELFLLRPIELVTDGENQLLRVASDDERLKFLREVFGTTSNLTAMQPVIIVEGVSENAASAVTPDRKLYRALHPGFDGVTLLPGGGKGECKSLLRTLNETLPSFSSHLKAYALLDRDGDQNPSDPRIHLLPVTMIENLLMDPDTIWDAIQSVVEKTSFSTPSDISSAITTLLDEMHQDEISRRTISALGLSYFRPKPPLNTIPEQAKSFSEEVSERYSLARIAELQTAAETLVAKLKADNRRREEFHGKTLLASFFKSHLHQTPISKVVFTFEAARHARRRKSVTAFFDSFFSTISTSTKSDSTNP